jgi:phosphomannomutase
MNGWLPFCLLFIPDSFTADLIVIQASQGLCQYVLKNVANAASRGVVIGHDHRYNSERWAELTAAVFVHAGFTTYLHRGLVHTPM